MLYPEVILTPLLLPGTTIPGGRTKTITCSDCETVYYGYDHGGNVISMYSIKGSDYYRFIDNIKYNEFGKRTKMYYNNGVEITFDYNPANQSFGAFSVGQSQFQAVIDYILNQKEHHKKKTFREEYIEFLNAYQIDFNPEYIFDDVGVAPTELKNLKNE